jgi:hypothetical protein
MSVLTTCPQPLLARVISARSMPSAHVRPPPAKSAKLFSGKLGFSGGPGNNYDMKQPDVKNPVKE